MLLKTTMQESDPMYLKDKLRESHILNRVIESIKKIRIKKRNTIVQTELSPRPQGKQADDLTNSIRFKTATSLNKRNSNCSSVADGLRNHFMVKKKLADENSDHVDDLVEHSRQYG